MNTWWKLRFWFGNALGTDPKCGFLHDFFTIPKLSPSSEVWSLFGIHRIWPPLEHWNLPLEPWLQSWTIEIFRMESRELIEAIRLWHGLSWWGAPARKWWNGLFNLLHTLYIVNILHAHSYIGEIITLKYDMDWYGWNVVVLKAHCSSCIQPCVFSWTFRSQVRQIEKDRTSNPDCKSMMNSCIALFSCITLCHKVHLQTV